MAHPTVPRPRPTGHPEPGRADRAAADTGATRRCWPARSRGWGPGRGARLGVRVPRRLGRGGLRHAHRLGGAPRDSRGAPAGGAAALRRDADAGGHPRLRPDGRDRRRPGASIGPPGSRTWSTSVVRPWAGCWPRWVPRATSPPPSQAPASASWVRAPSRRSPARPSRRASRPPRTCSALGIIDAVVPWEQVRERWATILRLWADRPQGEPSSDRGRPDRGSQAAARGRPAARGPEPRPGPTRLPRVTAPGPAPPAASRRSRPTRPATPPTSGSTSSSRASRTGSTRPSSSPSTSRTSWPCPGPPRATSPRA